MAKFKLVPYTIRVRKKNSDTNLNLSSLPTQGRAISFFDIFEKLCKNYSKNVYQRRKEKRTLCIINHLADKNKKLISGVIKSGEYGFEADFYDVKLKKRFQSGRKEEYSEEMPFFFLFNTPKKNLDIGFIIAQKFRQYGIKTILEKALLEILNSYNKDLIIELNPLISNKLLNVMKSSKKLLEIQFIKKEVPKDVADKNLIKNYEDIEEIRSFRVKRNRDLLLKAKTNLVKQLKNVEYPFSEIKKEKYDEIKLIIERNKTRSTITIEDLPRFRECMPLNPKSSNLNRGFPNESYLRKKAREYLNIILKNFDEEPLED